MRCKVLIIVFIVCSQLMTMDIKQPNKKIESIFYQYAIPVLASEVPSLKVLAAQKVHELNRHGKLKHQQLILFASTNKEQSASPEETICNELLQANFSQMKKENAEKFALDLAGGRVARSDSGGRVKQKILAIEMRQQMNR